MSAKNCDALVKKVVKKLVDDTVKALNDDDAQLATNELDDQGTAKEILRPVRVRKEPDRLSTKMAVKKQSKKEKKEEPLENYVMEMTPPPSTLRSILKQPRAPFPPPRKSSLTATVGMTITKKYRKVRVKRLLCYKVIPPLPGWRADRTRMPEDEPDEEEEQKRRDEIKEEEIKKEQKRRKRKSLGLPVISSVSEEDYGDAEAVACAWRPNSPDVFFECYMHDGSPDSVLTSDNEAANDRKSETLRAREAARVHDAQQDTVASEAPIDAKKRADRRRSVRIQPVEQPKAAQTEKEKKDRRKSKLFPVTPLKAASPPPSKTQPAEERKGRRSVVMRNEKKVLLPAHNPWNDDPCPTEEQERQNEEYVLQKRNSRVSDWLTKGFDAATAPEYDADGSVADAANELAVDGREIESVRAAGDSHDSDFTQESSTSSNRSRLVEERKPVQRHGRRSTRFVPKEDPKSKNKGEREEKTKPKQQQFFSLFAAPKRPAPAVEATVAAAAPAVEKKAHRRSMFVSKSAAKIEKTPFVQEEGNKKATEGDEQKMMEDDDNAIEIVGEVKRKAEKVDAACERTPASAAAAFWRSSEIDAAPYAGLVHVGWERAAAEDDVDEVARKIRRLSVHLPKLGSYAVPSSLLRMETDSDDDDDFVDVFDQQRTGCPDSVAAQRARELAADDDALVPWPEAIRPTRVEQCLGDQEELGKGKRWLEKWKKRLDKACQEEEKPARAPKKKRRRKGNYSDESAPEDSDSDYELRDDECRLPNPMVLCGPVGCGKTAYIRALSSEVGFSLLESAPDERRAGSNMRARLAEAVKSHRLSSKPAGGIASFFAPNTKNDEQQQGRKRAGGGQHTLAVIEHVDVVFAEEDKLFWPALADILATARIPVVLTCNVVPDELARILRQVEEADGGAEPLELHMATPAGSAVEKYVEASLAGSIGRALEATVVPKIVARARQDLRAALHDAHWAAAGVKLHWEDLFKSTARRLDEPAVCDTVAAVPPFAWTDECARRAEVFSTLKLLHNAAQWPQRGRGMPSHVYSRICAETDEVDLVAIREATARADGAMEAARSGLFAGSGGRSGLLTRRELATDWMPMLEQIDSREQEMKKTVGRRHQHYFNVIKNLNTGMSIDPLDRLQGACAFFRLPRSREEQK